MNNKNTPDAKSSARLGRDEHGDPMSQPQWADSLRSLYDSVVDEPIPDTFKDLLAQFDEPKKASSENGGSE
ncbi:NepR family anti-sigma factor [Citromicrobium bathyomarinum]|uniref:NepR family anti-sigma factor n=1 Tax=Citromicrobium bathyomarinum TaxID=72174 RepID=UPI00315AB4A2